MSYKPLLTVTFLGLVLTACSTTQPAGGTTAATSSTGPQSVDWPGSYSGVLPCDFCQGVETEVTLTSDARYVLSQQYFGKDESARTSTGTFSWHGNTALLDGLKPGEASGLYQVEEGRLRQLDAQGNEVVGELAPRYVLTKNGNPAAEDKRWQLVELFGRPVAGRAETHYLIFHSREGRLEAKANCNVLRSEYKIRNTYQLHIKPGASTLMACPDQQNLEQDLARALAQTDNLSVSATTLSLNKARMAPLARFELAKQVPASN